MFMCPSTSIKENPNALLLIPCCKEKRVIAFQGQSQPIHSIQPLRDQLLKYVQDTQILASRTENKRGILNFNAPLTQAIDLYVGNFYRTAGVSLQAILDGQYPSVHVLIVSAFYGLVNLYEGLKEYDLQMGDTLYNGLKVYQFWQQNQLWGILQDYINQNNIFYVWSLLPDSLPLFPYHRVFNVLWIRLRNTQIQCFHVQVPGAGTGTGYKRAEWLKEILNTNPNYLIGNPFPPNQLERIPNYTFNYESC